MTGEAGDEDERAIGDRPADYTAPIIAWPQFVLVPPNRNPTLMKGILQSVDAVGVLPHIGDKDMTARLLHKTTAYDASG